MKLLPIDVFRSKGRDCTNGGVSSRVDTIYIVHERGFITDISEIPTEQIFTVEQRGPNYYAARPLYKKQGVVGPMAGGNLAYSSDSRCPHVLHIHDRYETWEQYDHLSK